MSQARYKQTHFLTYVDRALESKFCLHLEGDRPNRMLVWVLTATLAAAAYAWEVCGAAALWYVFFPLISLKRSAPLSYFLRTACVLSALGHQRQYQLFPYIFFSNRYAALCEKPVCAQIIPDLLVHALVTFYLENFNLGSVQADFILFATFLFTEEQRHRRMWQRLDTAQRKSRQLRAVFEQLPVGVALVSPQHGVVDANKRARNIGFCDGKSELLASLRGLVDSCWKGELREEMVSLAGAATVVRSHCASWTGVDCCFLSLEDASHFITAVKSLLPQNRKALRELAIVENDAMRTFLDFEDLTDFDNLCRIHIAKYHLLVHQTLAKELAGECEFADSCFNLRSEFINAVELNSQAAENKQLSVTLAFEPGLPRSFRGDKDLTCQLFTTLYRLAAGLSRKNEKLTVVALVRGVQDNVLSLTVRADYVQDTAAAEKAVAEFNGSADDRTQQWTIEKSSLEAFFLLLKRCGGQSHANIRHSVTDNASLVTLSYQYSLRVQSQEDSFTSVLPSSFRRCFSADKSVWDFRPSPMLEKRVVKRSSVCLSGNLTNFKSLQQDSALLDTISELSPCEVAESPLSGDLADEALKPLR